MLEDRSTVKTFIDRTFHGAVRPAIDVARRPLEVSAHHVHGEPIAPAEAYRRPFEAFSVGQAWGGAWDTTWFHFRGTVPEEWAGRDVVARLDLGGGAGMVGFSAEGLLWDGDTPLHGVHHEHKDHPVGSPAAGGEEVDLFLEAAANPIPPWHLSDWPLLGPDYGGATLFVLSQADLVVVDREVEALWFDFRVLRQLLDHTPSEPRNTHVFRALAEAANAIDPRDVAGSAKAARAALAPVLAAPTAGHHRVTAAGHAHIDSAWLWPLRETKRKCARTFSNQLRLMEQYPEHHFTCSQAQQYAWIKDGYPTIWEQIKARVAEGRWEPVGGMWVEADTNLPSGESLVRQLVHGKRFFLDEFGVETHELWIPDVFGYSAALPQIANEAGVTAFVTQKMSWNGINRFPHHTFWWEGHDGSRLFTHFPPAATYCGEWLAHELINSVRTYLDHGRSDCSLYPFGYGDGGGGPNRVMLEYARRMSDLEGMPPVQLGTADAFLRDAQDHAEDLAVWVGELYLESHRGTYTTHADIKRDNRRNEEALRAAEMWSVAAGLESYPAAELDRLWKILLLHQFHDIIPGSGIAWVYEDSARDETEIAAAAGRIITSAQHAIAGSVATAGMASPVAVFNPTTHQRHEVIELPSGCDVAVARAAQTSDRGLALVEVSAPACGWTAVDLGEETPAATPPVGAGEDRIENAYLRVTWDADGLLTSVWDKKLSREVLADGRRGNVFQLHEDNPNAFDAWDVDLTYLDKVTDLVEVESIDVVERGPLRAAVRFVRRFGASSIVQTMRLTAGSRRLEFDTEVEWAERHRFLKVAFPVAIRSARATYEIQHGHIERPTVANTTWDLARFEVCGHRWADLSEAGYGVALLNDCKYGYDIRGDVMRLSLLRGPGFPDPEADRGTHRFRYALLPHPGDFRAPGGVVAEAEAFNQPLTVLPVDGGAAGGERTGQVVELDRPGVSVEAVKKADREDAVVVRLCEVWGSRGPVRVTLHHPATGFGRVTRTDLLERDREPLELDADGRSVSLRLRPFELVTLKFAP